MPSARHHHNHQCSCCCSCSSCCSSISTPSLPSIFTSDQLLQALTTQLLLQSQSQPQSQSLSSPHIYSHHYLKAHHPFYQTPPSTHQQSKDHHRDHQTDPLLHSLLRRVAALESSLSHLSSPSIHPPPPSPPPPPPHPQPSPGSCPPSSFSSASSSRISLRDAAARTIQTRFRLFLVRRSQTLRHLKRLASIKSHAAALRSSLSDQTARLDPGALSERAMGLLLQLDSIQSGDPMIREGKRSVSRELVRILEFVDKVLVKEHEMSVRALEIVDVGTHGSEGFEGVARVPDDGLLLQSTKPGKKVSFFENGSGCRASAGAPQHFLEDYEECSDRGLQRRSRCHIDTFGRAVAGIRIAEHSEPEERIHQPNDDERSSEGGSENTGRCGNDGKFHSQNGSLGGLSAPLPVQMERRRRV